MPTWGDIAKQQEIKYFLISFVDLFGTMRAKIVPASAIDAVAKSGAGFAGFAVWYDMTPADPDILATPDPDSLFRLPWKPEERGLLPISSWAVRRWRKIPVGCSNASSPRRRSRDSS